MIEILDIHVRLADAIDDSLPKFSFSALETVARCPMEGVLYLLRKRVPGVQTAQSLLAGNAAHRFFDAWHKFHCPDMEEWQREARLVAGDSMSIEARRTYALEALYNTGYCDAPWDTKRTIKNIQTACLTWADHQTQTRWRVVGSERKFELRFDIKFLDAHGVLDHLEFVYLGKIDAICQDEDGSLFPLDYKTASRIDTNYEEKWTQHPQLSGYQIALRTLFPYENVGPEVMVETVSIPQPGPRATTQGWQRQRYYREAHHIEAFFEWVVWQVLKVNHNIQLPHLAQREFTQDFRYNSLCQFKSMCDLDREGRKRVINDELETFIPYREEVWE